MSVGVFVKIQLECLYIYIYIYILDSLGQVIYIVHKILCCLQQLEHEFHPNEKKSESRSNNSDVADVSVNTCQYACCSVQGNIHVM